VLVGREWVRDRGVHGAHSNWRPLLALWSPVATLNLA
jgi:hypothetical protein